MTASLQRIRLIAYNTFLEALHQKFFSALLLISVGLILTASFFQQFDFGTNELKFIIDFGFGAIFFFGSILAISVMAQLFFNEIESRTVLTLLSKPVHRSEFLIGKFIGTQFLMLIFVFVLSLVLVVTLFWRESILLYRFGNEEKLDTLLHYYDIFIFAILQWVRFCVIGAFTLLICSFAKSYVYTFITSLFVLIVCQLQYIAHELYAHMDLGLTRLLAQLVAWTFPNFQLFNVGDQLVLEGSSSLSYATTIHIIGYGFIYVCTYIFLAYHNFKMRQI